MNDLNKKRLYIDTNVFLNPILYKINENQEAEQADIFLQKIINNEVEAHTSLLTWDEFVWVIRKELGGSIANQKGKEFLIFPNLLFEVVTKDIINKAQDLVEKYSIKPRDAIHLATTLNCKINEIITFDDDFKEIKEITYITPK